MILAVPFTLAPCAGTRKLSGSYRDRDNWPVPICVKARDKEYLISAVYVLGNFGRNHVNVAGSSFWGDTDLFHRRIVFFVYVCKLSITWDK